MRGKWRWIGSALLLGLFAVAVPLEAQRGAGRWGRNAQRPQGPNMGRSVELALEHREALDLEQEQVAQLQEIRAVMDGEVAGLAEEMKTLQGQIRAGEVDRDEGMRQMSALRGELMTASAPLRGRVQEILTVEQHNKLQPLVRESLPPGAGSRAFRGAGGPSARRGMMGTSARGRPRGTWGGKGLRSGRPGLRNPGFGRSTFGFRGRWGGGNPVGPADDGNLP